MKSQTYGFVDLIKKKKLQDRFKFVLKSKDLLWESGKADKKVFLVTNGLVHLELPNESGESHCLGVFGPGDILGLAPFLDQRPHRSTARVISRSASFIEIQMPENREDFLKDPSSARWVQEQLLLINRIYIDQIQILSKKSIESRLTGLFECFVGRFSKEEGNELPFSISKTEISKIVNARVETVIRLLSHWERDRVVKFKHDRIFLSDRLGELENK